MKVWQNDELAYWNMALAFHWFPSIFILIFYMYLAAISLVSWKSEVNFSTTLNIDVVQFSLIELHFEFEMFLWAVAFWNYFSWFLFIYLIYWADKVVTSFLQVYTCAILLSLIRSWLLIHYYNFPVQL